jgi:hypothetical protein
MIATFAIFDPEVLKLKHDLRRTKWAVFPAPEDSD